MGIPQRKKYPSVATEDEKCLPGDCDIHEYGEPSCLLVINGFTSI